MNIQQWKKNNCALWRKEYIQISRQTDSYENTNKEIESSMVKKEEVKTQTRIYTHKEINRQKDNKQTD